LVEFPDALLPDCAAHPENPQMKKTFGLLILGALALVAADDPFIGTWKLNVAKSTYSPGPPPQSQTVTIGADDPQEWGSRQEVAVSEVDGKGQMVNWSYSATPGTMRHGLLVGTATIAGVPDASVLEMRNRKNSVDHEWKMGKARRKGHGVISKDGRTMTYTLKGTDAEGKKVSNRSVYEKQ
jgi:hypothetical protein